MASQIPLRIIEGVALTTSAVSLYTSASSTKTLIKNLTLTNTSAAVVKVTIYLVPNGGSAGAASTITYQKNIAPGETYIAAPLINHVLEALDSIQALADTATSVTLMASGLQIVT